MLSFLDLPGTYSITDVLANMGRLDRDLLDTSVTRHASGLRVLAQSGKVEEAEQVRAADVVGAAGFPAPHYDHLVVDGMRGFDELSLAVLDASQQSCMVLTQDVPAVRNAKRCLELFRRLGYDERKIKLVLNRYQRQQQDHRRGHRRGGGPAGGPHAQQRLRQRHRGHQPRPDAATTPPRARR